MNLLSQARILVTRPAHQAGPLQQRLQAAGACVEMLPTIAIEFTANLCAARIQRACNDDLIIFTSANAVHGAHHVQALPWPLAAATEVAAIGPATGRALRDYGVQVDVLPSQGFSSEDLLQLLRARQRIPEQITIVRGDAGRELLRSTLRKLGSQVHYLQTYRRSIPVTPASEIRRKLANAHVICIGSDLGWSNLLTMTPADSRSELLETNLVVNSERCARLARQSGNTATILVARPAGDEGQLAALMQLMKT